MTGVVCRKRRVVARRVLVRLMLAKLMFVEVRRMQLARKEMDRHTRPTGTSGQEPRLWVIMRSIATKIAPLSAKSLHLGTHAMMVNGGWTDGGCLP